MSIFGAANPARIAALELGEIPTAKFAAVRTVMDSMGEAFARQWADNARETAGEHGKHYPDSITADRIVSLGGIAVDVGPDKSRRQGGMGLGFEFGSQNQPPHLDGLRAQDAIAPRIERAIDVAMGF